MTLRAPSKFFWRFRFPDLPLEYVFPSRPPLDTELPGDEPSFPVRPSAGSLERCSCLCAGLSLLGHDLSRHQEGGRVIPAGALRRQPGGAGRINPAAVHALARPVAAAALA